MTGEVSAEVCEFCPSLGEASEGFEGAAVGEDCSFVGMFVRP